MSAERRKPLYLDAAEVGVELDDGALRITRPRCADELIPIERVGRTVVERPPDGLLAACLALAERGRTVHFADGNGYTMAVLRPPLGRAPDWARELRERIEEHASPAPFVAWRDKQLRHGESLVFRHRPGDPDAAAGRLLRYLRWFQPRAQAGWEWRLLSERLDAWLEARLSDEGLHPVTGALRHQGGDLPGTLRDSLWPPLLWCYVRWRRGVDRDAVRKRELVSLFEQWVQATGEAQLQRHLLALATEYEAAGAGGDASDLAGEVSHAR